MELSQQLAETQGEILHIDAMIELRDYFHAYVDEAKPKLIAACLICAVVITAFTYFFVLIGEEKILLQLSPLFFGLPIVAVVGQYLRIHALYRKYLADLSESEKSVHYLFPGNGDGFDIVRGQDFSHVSWQSVRKVVERPRYFRFVFSKFHALIIPKRFFRTDTDEMLMRNIIASHMGSKARLPQKSQL
jgi:YcxB-like protein